MIGLLFVSWMIEEEGEEEEEEEEEEDEQQQQQDEEAQDGPRAGSSNGKTPAQDLSRSASESRRPATRAERPLQEKRVRRKKQCKRCPV